MIKFGPAGLGGAKVAIKNLHEFHNLGIWACEIAFTYSIYLKKDDAIKIGKTAKDLGISLSIHAPYYINLNSSDINKIKMSEERILKCAEIANYLEAKRIVFHPGFYGKNTPEQTFERIKSSIKNIIKKLKQNNWNIELCPETTGKLNVFGSIEEISRLVNETKCGFCIDFAHILARYKDYNLELVKKFFPQKSWHCHFSGIVYGKHGEKNHRKTYKEEWQELLKGMPKDKDITIINESPAPLEDSIDGMKIFEEMKK
ncbi:MAG: TIM barrel protein [Nanoarchaeota archaeon]